MMRRVRRIYIFVMCVVSNGNLVAKATRSDLAFGEEVQKLKLLDQSRLCPQVTQLTA
jgi:hypothetical protein